MEAIKQALRGKIRHTRHAISDNVHNSHVDKPNNTTTAAAVAAAAAAGRTRSLRSDCDQPSTCHINRTIFFFSSRSVCTGRCVRLDETTTRTTTAPSCNSSCWLHNRDRGQPATTIHQLPKLHCATQRLAVVFSVVGGGGGENCKFYFYYCTRTDTVEKFSEQQHSPNWTQTALGCRQVN